MERGIRTVVAAEGAMAVLVAVVSPGTGEEEFGEEGLTLMPAAVLTVWSMMITDGYPAKPVTERRNNEAVACDIEQKEEWFLQ